MDVKKIFEQVKENHLKLESCSNHNFSIDLEPDKRLGKRWQCSNCMGEVTSSEKHWYETGLKHGN